MTVIQRLYLFLAVLTGALALVLAIALPISLQGQVEDLGHRIDELEHPEPIRGIVGANTPPVPYTTSTTSEGATP